MNKKYYCPKCGTVLKGYDFYCPEIVTVLRDNGTLRFNAIFRKLKSLMSKPTLSYHLNEHLVKQDKVTRTVVDVQNVTYGLKKQ